MMLTVPLLLAALAGCAVQPAKVRSVPPVSMEQLLNKQVYQMSPPEVHRYIGHMQQAEPDLRRRIAAIGRQDIGQPYVLNPLGEYPFELQDTLPMFSLTHSDCVVFAEHTDAMALSKSLEELFWMRQRIRYKDGVIGVATRNHYMEQDWNGLVVTAPDGQRMFLNSAAPQVRGEIFDAFVQRGRERDAKNGPDGQKLAGFKFLRLNDHIVVPPSLPQPRPGS